MPRSPLRSARVKVSATSPPSGAGADPTAGRSRRSRRPLSAGRRSVSRRHCPRARLHCDVAGRHRVGRTLPAARPMACARFSARRSRRRRGRRRTRAGARPAPPRRRGLVDRARLRSRPCGAARPPAADDRGGAAIGSTVGSHHFRCFSDSDHQRPGFNRRRAKPVMLIEGSGGVGDRMHGRPRIPIDSAAATVLSTASRRRSAPIPRPCQCRSTARRPKRTIGTGSGMFRLSLPIATR